MQWSVFSSYFFYFCQSATIFFPYNKRVIQFFLRCGVDPETDYPIDKYSGEKGHAAFDPMYGYEHLKNIDGLSHIFIKKYYKYETLPQCPDCGSPYLYCDIQKQMCVSRDTKACDIPAVSILCQYVIVMQSWSPSSSSSQLSPSLPSS